MKPTMNYLRKTNMRVALLGLIILSLSGCGLFSKKEPEKVYVTKTEYVKINIPKDFRNNCKVTPPLKPEAYIELSQIEREEYLTDYIVTIFGEFKICNTTRKKVIELVDKNNELFKDKPDERKPKD